MTFVARWGNSAKTAERSDWVCNRALNKVGLLKERDVCSTGIVIAIPPASGPSNLTTGLLTPASGPSNLSSTLLAPVTGPSNLSSTLLAPAAGPSSLAASLQPPAVGPGNLSAVKSTLSISPLSTDDAFAVTPSTTGSAGDIKYSSDTEHLYFHDGTDWYRTNGRQPGEPYTVI